MLECDYLQKKTASIAMVFMLFYWRHRQGDQVQTFVHLVTICILSFQAWGNKLKKPSALLWSDTFTSSQVYCIYYLQLVLFFFLCYLRPRQLDLHKDKTHCYPLHCHSSQTLIQSTFYCSSCPEIMLHLETKCMHPMCLCVPPLSLVIFKYFGYHQPQ